LCLHGGGVWVPCSVLRSRRRQFGRNHTHGKVRKNRGTLLSLPYTPMRISALLHFISFDLRSAGCKCGDPTRLRHLNFLTHPPLDDLPEKVLGSSKTGRSSCSVANHGNRLQSQTTRAPPPFKGVRFANTNCRIENSAVSSGIATQYLRSKSLRCAHLFGRVCSPGEKYQLSSILIKSNNAFRGIAWTSRI